MAVVLQNVGSRPFPHGLCGAISLASGHDAASFHRSVAYNLRRAGFRVDCEFPMVYIRPNGRMVKGRIDIMAIAPDGSATALELDHKSARSKSLEKLCACPGAAQGVVLRDG